MNKGVRINKFISETGLCSRREADKLISAGRRTITGIAADHGSKVVNEDIVLVDGGKLRERPEKVYLAYNKPAGIVCTTDRSVRNNILDALDFPETVFTVGRLDKASTGLIFLTNDGDIVNRILRSGNKHEKEYRVTVNKPVDSDFLRSMSEGVPVLGTITEKCRVRKTGTSSFIIILTQGLNRQIRRMCEYFGYEVVSLHRVRIMNVGISTLKPGKWRHLTYKELRELRDLISLSSNSPANLSTNDPVSDDDTQEDFE